MAALVPDGPAPSLTWMPAPRPFVAFDLLHLIEHGIPRGSGALVVVLDNAGIHRSAVVAAARSRLRRRGISLYYLPPYAPELNPIEPVFGAIKHHDLPHRHYTTDATLTAAIDAAFARAETRLIARTAHDLRPAA